MSIFILKVGVLWMSNFMNIEYFLVYKKILFLIDFFRGFRFNFKNFSCGILIDVKGFFLYFIFIVFFYFFVCFCVYIFINIFF